MENRGLSPIILGFMVGGTQNGFTIQAVVSGGKGKADGQDVSHSNTHVEAGETLTLESGGDTTLKGAVAKGEKVIADIGKDLKIESLQDTSTYDSKQKSLGVSVSLCIPPFCVGATPVSGSVSASQSKINSDYASVAEQSAIRAGDQGFDVKVAGNTDLKGGAITSTQAAIDDNKNTFQTDGQLTLSDIQNKANYSAKSMGVNVGTSLSFDGALKPGGTSAGLGKDSGSASSTTLAGISGIAGNQAARTGDAETGIAKIFDAEKVQKEINAQVTITQSFGQQASKAVGDYVQTQKQTLREQYKNADAADRDVIQARFDDLILQERVMNVLIGAVTGFSGSALAKETLGAAADELHRISVEDSMKSKGIVDAYGNPLTNLRPGEENKLRQDRDLAGTRLDEDGWCGANNSRCEKQMNPDGTDVLDANGKTQLARNDKGQIQFIAEDDKAGNSMTLDEFQQTPEGKKMAGLTGGIQGGTATIAGYAYPAGGVVDRVLKAFAGTHDYIGGTLSGLYDEPGNTRRGRTDAEKIAHDAWSAIAIAPSAPFAMAELLPPEFWKAISILLGAVK